VAIVTYSPDGRDDTTKRRILRAAARKFAVTPYGQVSLDDVVADAEVTKGVFYSHFGSKQALANALVEHHLEVSWAGGADRIALGFGGLESLIDYTYLIAAADVGRPLTGAAVNLFESVGEFDGLQPRVAETWAQNVADIANRAIAQGDIRSECKSEGVVRLLTSLYLGLRPTSDLDVVGRFIGDLEAAPLMALPGLRKHGPSPLSRGFHHTPVGSRGRECRASGCRQTMIPSNDRHEDGSTEVLEYGAPGSI
jgi:TetR/AcrR family transcriptional repressor of nem operon